MSRFARFICLALCMSLCVLSQKVTVTQDCLGCMCQASTKCNMTIGCTSSGAYLCGPFLISKPYWLDAGKPTLEGDTPERQGAFEDCVHDALCAADTVRGYMNQYAQDCNRDGTIDCNDFARLHILGGFSCNAPLQGNRFFEEFTKCRKLVASLSG